MVRALAVSVAAFLVACGLSPAAFAQGADPVPPLADPVAPAATENGRFTMMPAGAGFLRLDTRSGAVSYCSLANGAAECRAAADDRAALMAEIDRLSRHAAQPGAAPPVALVVGEAALIARLAGTGHLPVRHRG